MWSKAAAFAAALALAACRTETAEPQFPKAHRPVAPIVGDTFSTEDARDRLGEAEQVSRRRRRRRWLLYGQARADCRTEGEGPGRGHRPRYARSLERPDSARKS